MATKVQSDLIYFISGMWCTTCAKSISTLVSKMEGVDSAQINYTTKLLLVKPKNHTDFEKLDGLIQQGVTRIGFSIKKQSENWLMQFQNELKSEAQQKITWVQIGIVWFLAMWSSMIAFTGYLGGLAEAEIFYLSLASSAFGLPAILIGAYPYAKSGLKAALYSRLITVDLFIFLGAMAAVSISLWSHFNLSPTSYADSGSMILALLLSTKKLENTISQNAALNILFQIHPSKDLVEVYKKEQWQSAQVSQIRMGNLIRIKASQTIAFDGTIENKNSKINNHLISGEDHQIEVKQGDSIFAGAIALEPALLRVTATPGQRKIDTWAESALLAENGKDRFQKLFARIESSMVALAFGGATLIAAIQFIKDQPTPKVIESFFIGILIFCPCLFASIIPLSKKLSHLFLYKKGILLSRSEALLDLLSIKNFYFDKTGTLETVESHFVAFGNESAILPFLKEISVQSKHIILREMMDLENVTAKPVVHLIEYPGQGLSAQTESGQQILIGRPEFLEKHNVKELKDLDPLFSYVTLHGRVMGQIVQQKTYNEKSLGFLKSLFDLMPNLNVEILSGDPDLSAMDRYLSLDSRIKYHGNLSPEQKKNKIQPQSAFIGDGLNDTIALAKAQVSFRIGSRVSGQLPIDFYLQRPDLNLIIQLIEYAKKYRSILIQTGMAALIYNVIAITLAAFGKFSPLGAVVAMISSFSLMLLSISRLQFLERRNK